MNNYWSEEYSKVIEFVDFVKPCKILDVGCGQGRYAIPLSQKGYRVTGVDKNYSQTGHLTQRGIPILTQEDFNKNSEIYDLVIMSHVIEHVPSSEIIEFIDCYLEKLNPNGHLIIATPLLHSGFYDDYDHVHPYNPSAICGLYSDYPQQQAKPQHRLVLRKLWIRQWPFILPGDTKGYSCRSILKRIINNALNLLFTFSGRLIGRKTGWVGLFRKIK